MGEVGWMLVGAAVLATGVGLWLAVREHRREPVPPASPLAGCFALAPGEHVVGLWAAAAYSTASQRAAWPPGARAPFYLVAMTSTGRLSLSREIDPAQGAVPPVHGRPFPALPQVLMTPVGTFAPSVEVRLATDLREPPDPAPGPEVLPCAEVPAFILIGTLPLWIDATATWTLDRYRVDALAGTMMVNLHAPEAPTMAWGSDVSAGARPSPGSPAAPSRTPSPGRHACT
jgi:hypothetical protein